MSTHTRPNTNGKKDICLYAVALKILFFFCFESQTQKSPTSKFPCSFWDNSRKGFVFLFQFLPAPSICKSTHKTSVNPQGSNTSFNFLCTKQRGAIYVNDTSSFSLLNFQWAYWDQWRPQNTRCFPKHRPPVHCLSGSFRPSPVPPCKHLYSFIL